MRAAHLKDEKDLWRALRDGTLPSVAWFKPLDVYTDNAGEGSMLVAEQRIVELIEAVKASTVWPRTAIVISWDDYGGFFDHVAPPVIDRWGPSNRVPTIIISPWAKRSHVDSTTYETVSILRFIEWRWGRHPWRRATRRRQISSPRSISRPPRLVAAPHGACPGSARTGEWRGMARSLAGPELSGREMVLAIDTVSG